MTYDPRMEGRQKSPNAYKPKRSLLNGRKTEELGQPEPDRQQPEGRGTDPEPFYRNKKHQFFMGLSALLMAGAFFLFDTTGTTKLEDVKANGIGSHAQAGTVLAALDDDTDLQPRDFTVTMKEGTTSSRVQIWDFAAEDGDVVTVKVNGSIIAENIGILHKPAVLDIPVPSVVEIVGVKDGGGGITYGVKFPGAVGNSAYFNAAPVGSANAYTIQ